MLSFEVQVLIWGLRATPMAYVSCRTLLVNQGPLTDKLLSINEAWLLINHKPQIPMISQTPFLKPPAKPSFSSTHYWPFLATICHFLPVSSIIMNPFLTSFWTTAVVSSTRRAPALPGWHVGCCCVALLRQLHLEPPALWRATEAPAAGLQRAWTGG